MPFLIGPENVIRVVVGISWRRKVFGVGFQQVSTELLGEIRAERIRFFSLLLLAKFALVDLFTRMQVRRQDVLPEILLQTQESFVV